MPRLDPDDRRAPSPRHESELIRLLSTLALQPGDSQLLAGLFPESEARDVQHKVREWRRGKSRSELVFRILAMVARQGLPRIEHSIDGFDCEAQAVREVEVAASDWVIAQASSISSSPHDAEDIAQDAWVRLLERNYRVEKPIAYIRQALRNIARSRRSRTGFSPLSAVEELPAAREDRADAEVEVLDELVFQRRLLRKVLRRLPAQDAHLLQLALRGFSLAQMATVLQLKHAAVKKRVQRAIQRARVMACRVPA